MTDYAIAEPMEFAVGDSVAWVRSFDDYPASDSWALTYALINASGKITITSSAHETDSHLVSLSPATTAAYTAGTYKWQAYVTDGTDRYLVDSGTVTILPDFSAATTYDGRSHAKIVLDAIEATIEGVATSAQLRVTVRDKALENYSLEELHVFRSRYRAEVKAEEKAEAIANGLGHRGRVQVRFV